MVEWKQDKQISCYEVISMKNFKNVLGSLLLCSSLLWSALPVARAAEEPSDWAQSQVKDAISNGLVPNDLQSAYQQPITRQDFCRLAVTLVEVQEGKTIAQVLKAKNITLGTSPFGDSKDSSVLAANALGIVNGYEDGSFRPNGSISRQEAAKMLHETAKVLGATTGGAGLSYTDVGSIQSYAVSAVKFVSSQGIMNGVEGNRFAPTDPYTRQQAYVTMYRLLSTLESGGQPPSNPGTTGKELSASEISTICSPAVAFIVVYDADGQPQGAGSGFAVSSDGKIVTNYHVISGAHSATVTFTDKTQYKVEKVLGYDMARDVAVLKINATGLKTLALGDSAQVVSGQTIYTLGSPQGLENTIANGIISAVNRPMEGQSYIQITAPISPGSSGGALLDSQGRCIGIPTMYIGSGQNLNFAIPIDEVKPYLTQTKNMTLAQVANAKHQVKEYGIYFWEEYALYTGELNGEGEPDGTGKVVWSDGSTLEGSFARGMVNGKASYKDTRDGSSYVGDYVDDMFQGTGTLTFDDGQKYVGQFKEGYFHGQGTYYFEDGSWYTGTFSWDTMEGQGTYYYVTGEKYVGAFFNDLFHGYGTLYDATGQVIRTGKWVAGRFVS